MKKYQRKVAEAQRRKGNFRIKSRKKDRMVGVNYEDNLSYQIIGAAIEVHTALGGPCLLESMYEEALVYELRERGLVVERQKPVPVVYKGKILADPLRIDILVESSVIIECKAVAL